MKKDYMVAVFDLVDNLISLRSFGSRNAAREFARDINKESPYYARFIDDKEIEEINERGYIN